MMMQDIAMHVLDIGMNALVAHSHLVEIFFEENTNKSIIRFEIIDDGIGMDDEELVNAQSPFYTTRTTRKFGFGIPFIKAATEMCGGNFLLQSKKGYGTNLKAEFNSSNIDCPPIGDIAGAIVSLMVFDETINLIYHYKYNDRDFVVTTDEIKRELKNMAITIPSIQVWLGKYIAENMYQLKKEEQS